MEIYPVKGKMQGTIKEMFIQAIAIGRMFINEKHQKKKKQSGGGPAA